MAEHPELASLARVLAQHGYRLRSRRSTWWECLLEGHGESWTGAGSSLQAAVEDALGQALPSALGRALLQAGLAASGEPVAEPEREPGRPTPPDREPATGAAPGPSASGDPPPAVEEVPPTAGRPAAAVQPREPAEPAEPCEPVACREPAGPREPADPPAAPQRQPRKLPPMTSTEAVDEVQDLLARIHASVPEVAGWAPEWQRLRILGWIAAARAIQDANTAAGVRRAVAAAAGELGRLAAVWWPGYVSALRQNAYPAECAPEGGSGGGGGAGGETPLSWLEVHEQAEQALQQAMDRADEAGADERGWFDAEACRPGPPDPGGALREVVAALEKRTGALDGPGERLPAADAEGFDPLELARKLRWIRPSTVDTSAWGAAVGRLRWIASRSSLPAVRAELDPRAHPPQTWCAVLGHDPHKRERARRRKAMLEALQGLRGRAAAPEAVERTLVEAVGCEELSVERLVGCLRPWTDAVRSLDPARIAGERRVRRRLRKLQEALVEGEGGEGPDDALGAELDRASRELEQAGQSAGDAPIPDAQEEMLRQVLPHTRGRRALVVGNRADPELDGQLVARFELESLDHEEASPRKLDALVQRILNQRYDLVLSLTGFQGHSTDRLLSKAAGDAGVLYCRSFRGRPLACLQALHRDLGGMPGEG